MTRDEAQAALDAYAAGWEQAGPGNSSPILDRVTEDVHFVDPFNDLRGRDRLGALLDKTYAELRKPRFTVHDAVIARMESGEGVGLIHWRLEWGEGEGTIEGTSRVVLEEDGRVRLHQDYWDPTGPIYERVPVLASIMRLIRRRLGI